MLNASGSGASQQSVEVEVEAIRAAVVNIARVKNLKINNKKSKGGYIRRQRTHEKKKTPRERSRTSEPERSAMGANFISRPVPAAQCNC